MKENIFDIIIDDTKKIYDKKKYRFLKDKCVLITGSTGILGNYMVGFFLNSLKSKFKPKKITLIFKSKLPAYLNFLKKNKRFKLVRKDLSLSKKINLKKQDYILHLAGYGQPMRFMDDPIKTFELNTGSLNMLLKKINQNGSFLYLSSSELYSGLNGKIKEDKIGLTNTNHPRACYIESKRGGETIMNIYREKFGINAKSARLCLAYGPGTKLEDKRVLNQFIEKALKLNSINMNDSGTALRSYIYVADATKMLLNILFFGKKPIYNVGGKEKISIIKLAKKISRILKVPVVAKKTSYSKGFGAPKNAFVNISLYEKEFKNSKFVKLDEGLRNTIKWQKMLY